MIERLMAIEERYNSLTEKLMEPEVISNIKQTLALTREQSSLKDAYEAYQQYKKLTSDLEAAKEMSKDPELGEFAKEEQLSLEENLNKLNAEIEILLLPKDENDGKNVIVEIRGAAGGDEANIFAGDLYRMYTKYAEKLGFKIEVLNSEDSEAGGFSQIEFMVKGENVYSKL